MRLRICIILLFAAVLVSAQHGPAQEVLRWETNKEPQVTADIKHSELVSVLKKIAGATGWRVYVEPQTLHTVSTKFKNLAPGQALRLLLGDVNFALIPGTGSESQSHLYVFRTTMSHATQRVIAAEVPGAKDKSRAIPDQLVVRLRPGAKIDDLARLFGAKIIGKIDAINTYLLKFGDKDAADAALAQLAQNGDVASIENNYSIDKPDTQMQPSGGPGAGPPSLQLKDPPASGRIIVGLVDTQVQSLGSGLDSFMLKQLSAVDEGQIDPSAPTHGTAMAETMLRAIQQETQGKTAIGIQPVDVFGMNENTTTFDVANGIVIAYNNGAKVINLSLGSTADADILHDLIDQLTQKDILVIGAKGNQPTTQPFFPAAYNNVVAVTALDSMGQLASYANRADIPALGAPGTSDIYFNHQTWQVTGTSPAAADVSGLAAGYMEQNSVNASKARTWLQQNLPKK